MQVIDGKKMRFLRHAINMKKNEIFAEFIGLTNPPYLADFLVWVEVPIRYLQPRAEIKKVSRYLLDLPPFKVSQNCILSRA